MTLYGTNHFNAPRDRGWAAFTDPADATRPADGRAKIVFQSAGYNSTYCGRTERGGKIAFATGQTIVYTSPADAMESRPIEFHRRLRTIFRELPTYYPRPVAIVDAAGDADSVYRRIVETLELAAF